MLINLIQIKNKDLTNEHNIEFKSLESQCCI